MAKFQIKLGPTPQESEVIVNGRKMQNIIGLRIQQGSQGPPQVSITIVAEVEIEGQGEVIVNGVKQ